MKLKNFEDWFAIRSNHGEGDYWPGRLVFDLQDGISLTTARFVDGPDSHGDPTFHRPTMTGWLDYQRPATLIQPWIQSVGGMTFSMDTPAMRASYRFVANALLKNVFLEDINEPIFTGLAVDDPALNAWLNPNLVSHDWDYESNEQGPRLSVGVADTREREITLSNGTVATVTSTTGTAQDDALTLQERSILRLRFAQPVTFDAITRLTWRISTVFAFLLGARVGSPVYQMPTTQTRLWNEEERPVIAELWYRPSLKGADKPPHVFRRLMVEGRNSPPLERVLNLLVGQDDELLYLANIIQTVEDNDMPIAQGYGELLGCLESFDTRQFGTGAAPDFRERMRSLAAIMDQHGSETDREFFESLRRRTGNSFSLLLRLQRLHSHWQDDGFRCNPSLHRIRDIRNLLPHGNGLAVSSEVAQEMLTFSQYLTALGRYHVLKAIGCTGQDDPPPLKWSDLKYGFESLKEDGYGKTPQARRDCREAAAG